MAEKYPFKDMVFAVTGASRGTGLALAKYLLIRGAKVSMCATTAANLATGLEEIEKEVPDVKGRVMTKVVDIGKLDTVQAWLKETVEVFGHLDGAANVAAVEQRKVYQMQDLDPVYFEMLLRVNVVGTWNCMREEMRYMKDGGCIINVGSIASKYATGGTSAYIASKHALIGLTKVGAFEGAKRRIRVNIVCPGCIDTEMMSKSFESAEGEFYLTTDTIPSLTKRLAEPWEVAASIAFLMGPEGRFVNKSSWYIDGGWNEAAYTSL
ncbi:short chain dehydrogenase family protein [Colletotrichum karsti]|uniref:Short chain dehydrogenase family protein n=1 Tax=Colletotrichum karsti TaxID=1095194 RepID=A0A9P6IJS1_9PEZI|nr:short chain dehydrogenase family protein [Colletotrichum karsti]KAF9881890.1 short chain dehydrogenase family protein [Colletotrichum karsti]